MKGLLSQLFKRLACIYLTDIVRCVKMFVCVVQESVQMSATASRSRCPPAVPKRGPDTRLSSASSSSESSVISLQVMLHSVSSVCESSQMFCRMSVEDTVWPGTAVSIR